jgi:hypothetical protein
METSIQKEKNTQRCWQWWWWWWQRTFGQVILGDNLVRISCSKIGIIIQTNGSSRKE